MKRRKNGFTLSELLIVVAIVAVLVAVSMPIFNKKLEKAREATDWANMRAAKAAAITAYLNAETITFTFGGTTYSQTFGKDFVICYYDAASGKLVGTATHVRGYGKGTGVKGGCESCSYCKDDNGVPYNESSDVQNMYIIIFASVDGDISFAWAPVS